MAIGKQKENTEISDRISRIIEILGSNPNSFAKELGYTRAQTLYDIVNGKSAPSYDFFRRFQMSEYSALINIDWLLTDRGEMLINPIQENKNTLVNTPIDTPVLDKNGQLMPKREEGQITENVERIKNKNIFNEAIPVDKPIVHLNTARATIPNLLQEKTTSSVPFYNIPVTAGSLGILDLQTASETAPSGFIELEAFNGCQAAFPIIGVSMEPVINSGDIIGVKTIDNLSIVWDFIQTGVIYLIITQEERMIKFIEEATENDYIICTSPNYKPFKVHKGEVLEIYRVKACIKKL